MEFFPGLFLPADRDRWVDRILAGLHAFETVLGVSLRDAHSGTKFHATTKPVPDRRKFLLQRLKTKNRWFSLFSGQGLRRTPDGPRNIDYFLFGGSMYWHDDLFCVKVMTPELSGETAEKLLVALGDALELESAQYSPEATARRLRLAHWCIKIGDRGERHPLEDRTEAEERLPIIRESTYDGLSPLQPHHFGWLNYWSKEVSERQAFPARAQGGELLDHSYQTPRGGWLIKFQALAPAPGDDRFAQQLRAAYERFPAVGYRLGM